MSRLFNTFAVIAAEDLSDKQFHAITMTGRLASGDDAQGVLLNKPRVGETATVIYAGVDVMLALDDEGVSEGDLLTVTENGKFARAIVGQSTIGTARASASAGARVRSMVNFLARVALPQVEEDFVEVSFDAPTVISLAALTEQLGVQYIDRVDISLRDTDIIIQFVQQEGDEDVLEYFDPSMAVPYARNYDPEDLENFPGFDVEPIGVPVGSTHAIVMALRPETGRILTRAYESDIEYGGSKYELAFDGVGLGMHHLTIATPPLVTNTTPDPNTGDPWTMVLMCVKPTALGSTQAVIAGLYPAEVTNVLPVARVTNSAAGRIAAVFTNNGNTDTVTITDAQDFPAEEPVMLAIQWDPLTITPRLFRMCNTLGFTWAENGTLDLGLNTDTLLKLLVGANGSSAQPFLGGKLLWLYLTRCLLNQHELLPMYGPGAPPAPQCVFEENRDKGMVWLPIRSNEPKKCYISNRQLAVGTGSTAGNMVPQALSNPEWDLQRASNRWQRQSHATVVWHSFGADESVGESPGTGTPTGEKRSIAEYAVDIDVGATPDPDGAENTPVLAGVDYPGAGPSEFISAENDSGTATEVGQLVLQGLEYAQREGEIVNFTLTGKQQEHYDIEFVQYGDDTVASGWRDPNAPDTIVASYQTGAGQGYVTVHDPVTCNFVNGESDAISLGTGITPISTSGKGPHPSTGSYASKWVIVATRGTTGMQAFKWVPVYVDGVLDSFTGPTQMGDTTTLPGAPAQVVNLLGIQNPDSPTIVVIGQCGAQLAFYRNDTDTWTAIPNSGPTADIGYRWIRNSNYILNCRTTGAAALVGRIQVTDWTTGVSMTFNTDKANTVNFDPQGDYSPEFNNRLILAALTDDRQTLTVYRPTGPLLTDAFVTHLELTADDFDTGPATGANVWAMKSPEIYKFRVREGVYRTFIFMTLMDIEDYTGNPLDAERTQVWVVDLDGNRQRNDQGRIEVSTPWFNHENEGIILGPDAGGRQQMAAVWNTGTTIGDNTMNALRGCWLGIFGEAL